MKYKDNYGFISSHMFVSRIPGTPSPLFESVVTSYITDLAIVAMWKVCEVASTFMESAGKIPMEKDPWV